MTSGFHTGNMVLSEVEHLMTLGIRVIGHCSHGLVEPQDSAQESTLAMSTRHLVGAQLLARHSARSVIEITECRDNDRISRETLLLCFTLYLREYQDIKMALKRGGSCHG